MPLVSQARRRVPGHPKTGSDDALPAAGCAHGNPDSPTLRQRVEPERLEQPQEVHLPDELYV